MQYLIAIDIGTTSTKALAVDAHGATLASWSVSYKLNHTQDGASAGSISKGAAILRYQRICDVSTDRAMGLRSFHRLGHGFDAFGYAGLG